jgi:hypothetical protein
MTMDGAIVADYITTGSLTANIIKAGILTDLKGKFTLDMINGTLTMKDGTFSGTINASTITGGTVSGTTINGGTITGTTIQNAATGSRVLMDSSSSLKGYYNNTLHNIINMSNRNNTNNDLIIDADHQLHIRTPKVYVSNQSYGTGSGTVYETRSDNIKVVHHVSKNYEDKTELWIANSGEDDGDVYCTLPVVLDVTYDEYSVKNGMWITGNTRTSDSV